jgi:tetratricopeptide (TPR) repeat protein
MAMAASSRTKQQVDAALMAVEDADTSDADKAQMLMEIAMGLQQAPREPADLYAAVDLYRRALALVPMGEALGGARIRARLATALMAVPAEDEGPMKAAKVEISTALATLTAEGSEAEIAEAEMNLGLICQTLAGWGLMPIQPAISAYQRALRTFDRAAYPKEFAILQNNLATAFMSMPFTDEAGKMREALAVQAFEEGLKVVSLIDHPVEYAMLQNNLGNALQYVSTSHRVENSLRALDAYDEALKVRTLRDMPEAYANTIANKANCLANLPDDMENPEAGNPRNVQEAIALMREAQGIFQTRGEAEKARSVAEAIAELSSALAPHSPFAGQGVH